MYFIQHHTVELCRNSSELVEIFPAQIPVYVLHLIPYYANIILQNLYESEHARKLGNGEKNMAKYKFSNKLMFALVMQDEEICAEFIQRLFPGKKVKSITFPNDIKITPEKTIVTGVLSKSVRLDVLFEGENEVYDIEMQVETEPELPKRSRYYHTSMDTHFLKKGRPYKNLKPSYVIFICMKDPFERGEAIYQFQMVDKNLQLQLNDETYTIILAIDCPKGKIPKELETFFTYVEREEVDENDDFVKRIHEKVEEVNQDAEVTEIMTIEEEMNIRWHYGYDEGEAAGLKKGRSEGEAIGLEKGVEQEKREIAKNLKDLGVGAAEIIKATGLSAEEVEEL